MEKFDNYRSKSGFIIIEDIPDIEFINDFRSFAFMYQGTKYYYKYVGYLKKYNELIAEELAHDFGIKCAKYDVALINGKEIVISEDILKEKDAFTRLSDIVKDRSHNSLEDIWSAFIRMEMDYDTIAILMDEIVDMFLFDALISNKDRHPSNYGIVENKEGIHLAPLYDNYAILDITDCIEKQAYALNVSHEEVGLFTPLRGNTLNQFLEESDKRYTERLRSKLWIISEENIENVIARVERKIHSTISITIKAMLKDGFKKNRLMIEDSLKRIDALNKKYQ